MKRATDLWMKAGQLVTDIFVDADESNNTLDYK